MNTKNIARYAASLLALAFTGSAFAGLSYNNCGGGGTSPSPTCASYSWTFTSTTPGSNPPGVAVAATGYHQDGGYASADTFTARPLTIYSPDHLSLNYNDASLTSAQLATNDATNAGSGTESSPYHAIDNNSGYDLVIFQFAKPVTLSQISMGWVNTDTDFSLFAFNPVTPGQTPIAGAPPGSDAFSASNMLSKGWNLIGSFDYDSLATGGTDSMHTNGTLNLEAITAGAASTGTAKNILNYASSYWAIGAVIGSLASAGPTYAGVGSAVSEGTSGDDRFKIASIAGCYTTPPPPGVPEPASLALVGLALAGAHRSRRKRVAQA